MGKSDVPGVPGEVCWRLIGGGVGGLLLNFGFPCPGRGFGWLGFWGWSCSGRRELAGASGGARADVPRSVLARYGWSRSLGLGWPGFRSGWSDDGTSFWDTRYIHTF